MRNTLIDLLDDLVEVKSEFVTLKAVLLNKEEEIQNLKTQLEDKTKLTFDGKIYWLEGDKTPYCSKCYEKDSLAFHLSLLKLTLLGAIVNIGIARIAMQHFMICKRLYIHNI